MIELNEISQLLNLDYQILINCLTRGDGNWNQLDLGPELDAITASRTKNVLCRTLYGRLFTWAVNRLNVLLKVDKNQEHVRRRSLGLLDFYGFEILTKNSFEQLAINYCNERLHQVSVLFSIILFSHLLQDNIFYRIFYKTF